MSDNPNIRQERIERLLRDLQYEITRGMMDGEIDEHLTFQFAVPTSKAIKNGAVWCRFETRPMPLTHLPWNGMEFEPRLKVVK